MNAEEIQDAPDLDGEAKAAGGAFDVLNVTDDLRLPVEAFDTSAEDGGGMVKLDLRADNVTATVYLEPRHATDLADRLAGAAEDATELCVE